MSEAQGAQDDPDLVVDARARSSARARVLVIGGVLPVAIMLVPALLVWSWLPELPDPVAIHWSGASAEPDGFGSAWGVTATVLLIAVAFAAFAVVIGWRVTAAGRLLPAQKTVVVTAVWLAAFLSIIVAGSLGMQRGIADAADAGSVLPWLGFGLLGGALAALVAWPLLPRVDRTPGATSVSVTAAGSASRAAAPSEWRGVARLGRAGVVVMLIAMVVLGGSIVVAALAGADAVIFAVLGVVIALTLVAMLVWRVRVDDRGLVVTSMLGWPRTRIAPEQIREVLVAEIDPMRDFGGWGWRMDATGRSGVVVRRGPAIEVVRNTGRRFVVTVPDAETGAAALAEVARRPRRIQ